MKRLLPWVLWSLTIGLAIASEIGSRPAGRIDPGFGPLVTAIATRSPMWTPMITTNPHRCVAFLQSPPRQRQTT